MYHLQSIVDRFGKEGSAPAKYGRDGAFSRASKGFMNKTWDGGDVAFNPETWHLLGQHMYPGAFGMAFASSRGWHRLAVAIEDGGFIIHPSIFLWAQSQGFPKATRIDNQVDKELGMEQEVVGKAKGMGKQNPEWNGMAQGRKENSMKPEYDETAPTSDLAKSFEGHRYGLQALKPVCEPIILFQKPYDGRPIENIMETGAGSLNIDAGRIGVDNIKIHGYKGDSFSQSYKEKGTTPELDEYRNSQGRWPANFVLSHAEGCQVIGTKESSSYSINRFTDGAKPFGNGAGHEYESEEIEGGKEYAWECVEECPVKRLGEQSGETAKLGNKMYQYDNREYVANRGAASFLEKCKPNSPSNYGDQGTAARFFQQSDWSYEILEQIESADPVRYCAKVSVNERDAGVDGKCSHPTIKPLSLLNYLCGLLLPPDYYAPNRRLLVPFSGAGSEVASGILSGWDHITGIEMTEEYIPIAQQRLKFWSGWAEKGITDPKEILRRDKEVKKNEEKNEGQMRIFGE